MKHRERRAESGLLLLCLILSASSEAYGAINNTGEADPLRCISFYSSVNGLNSTIYYVTQSISECLEGEKNIALSVYCLPSDLYESVDYKIKTAAALDMDLMILSSFPEELDDTLQQELEDNEIFALIVDGQPSDYKLSACIGTDNLDAGVQAAKSAEKLSGAHQVGIVATSFRSSEISASRQERRDGFVQEAETYQNMTVVGECVCSSNALEAMQTVQEFLEEYPGIDVLYCLDSSSGITASEVLRQMKREKEVTVICFDNTDQVQQEMDAGGIDMVLVQNTEKIGQECAEFLLQMSRREMDSLCQKQISIPCLMVTADEEQR